jgi:hypothetical protein
MLRFSGGRQRPLGPEAITAPFTRMSPSSGRSSPAISRSVVLLPQPLGPSSVSVSPRYSSKLTRSTAVVAP